MVQPTLYVKLIN